MNLLIPVNSKEYENAQICSLDTVSMWSFVQIENGSVKQTSFHDKKEDVWERADYLIVKAQNENINEFIQEGITVLVAPVQRYIDDINEAFRFCELHEINA